MDLNDFSRNKNKLLGIFVATQEPQTIKTLMEYTFLSKGIVADVVNVLLKENKVKGFKNTFELT